MLDALNIPKYRSRVEETLMLCGRSVDQRGSIADGTEAGDAGGSQGDATRRVPGRNGTGGSVVGAVCVDRAALSESSRGSHGSATSMFRIHFLQQWDALSKPSVEEALRDSQAMRRFVAIDLFLTPQVRKQTLGQTEIVADEPPISTRARATAVCTAISLAWPIGTIVAAVAVDLSGDAAGVQPQHADLRGIAPLRSQGREHIPLYTEVIWPYVMATTPFLPEEGSLPKSQIASLEFHAGRCALTC